LSIEATLHVCGLADRRKEGNMSQRPVALVTGASSGIGFASASLLAARGYRTFGTSRHPDQRPGPKGVEMLQLDVSSDASVRAAVAEIATRAGPIGVLVNNAGFGLFGAVEETSLEEARNQFETTFWGAVRLIEQVLPGMRERRSGRIVNVSSVLGFMPVPFQAFYVASKHALEGYSEVLGLEVRPFGIFVSLIEPSFIRTGFFENRREASAPLDTYRSMRARVSPMMRERTDAGTDPDVVARVILKAITTSEPAVRYPVGLNGTMLQATRSFLPAFVFDRVLRKSFALDEG
jgi:NAD(P)-dependent dehydrogenase (short-subunit alcohol dehydrogenase family)